MERIETLETSNADLIKRVKTLEDVQINKSKGTSWEDEQENSQIYFLVEVQISMSKQVMVVY